MAFWKINSFIFFGVRIQANISLLSTLLRLFLCLDVICFDYSGFVNVKREFVRFLDFVTLLPDISVRILLGRPFFWDWECRKVDFVTLYWKFDGVCRFFELGVKNLYLFCVA